MAFRTESNNTIRDQAIRWITILDGGEPLPASDLQQFHSWLAVPQHAREYEAFRYLIGMVQDLPKEKAASLVAISTPRSWFPSLAALLARPVRLSVAAVAVVTVVVVISWSTLRPVREFTSKTYETGIGEARTVILPDGSTAHMNTQTRIRWIGSGKDRHVALEKGEVLFEVNHDPTRPFRVTAGNSEIRDLATQFDVYRKATGSIVVTVLSGQVAVKEVTNDGAQPTWTERLLKPDEQIEYTPASLIADVHKVTAAKSVRWREGSLETEGLSFATIVSELNRYSTKQILIADPRLAATDVKIGARLSIHDIPGALEHIQTFERIQQLEPIVVTDTGDSFVLTYKVDASPTGRSSAPQQDAAGRP